MIREDSPERLWNLIEKLGYRVVYVPHEVIEDYNATYNVMFKGKLITTNASNELGIPLNEIWISRMWKPYERYILFHELKEIKYKAEGMPSKQAHQRAVLDGFKLWKNDPAWTKMIRAIRRMDQRTRMKKKQIGRTQSSER